jgi:hypothetical protein
MSLKHWDWVRNAKENGMKVKRKRKKKDKKKEIFRKSANQGLTEHENKARFHEKCEISFSIFLSKKPGSAW